MHSINCLMEGCFPKLGPGKWQGSNQRSRSGSLTRSSRRLPAPGALSGNGGDRRETGYHRATGVIVMAWLGLAFCLTTLSVENFCPIGSEPRAVEMQRSFRGAAAAAERRANRACECPQFGVDRTKRGGCVLGRSCAGFRMRSCSRCWIVPSRSISERPTRSIADAVTRSNRRRPACLCFQDWGQPAE